MRVLFEFRHFLAQRTRLRISKIRVSHIFAKNLIDEMSLSIEYKRHLRRWRASEKRFGFLKEEFIGSPRLNKWTFTTCK